MNFWNRWIGDYLRDTRGCSLAEHGAYALLLDEYYASEKPLPDDIDRLCRLCGAITEDERLAVERVVDAFFPLAEDGLRHNARADREVARAKPRIAIARENGRRGGRPRNNPLGLLSGNPQDSHEATHGQSSPDPDPDPDPDPEDIARSARSSPHIVRKVFAETVAAEFNRTCPSLPEVRSLTDARIRSVWARREERVAAGRPAEAAEYWQMLFAEVEASDFLTGRGGDRRWRADFDWLLKPSNFAKVIEGTYRNRGKS